MQENSFRQVPLIWAGRVRTGNKQTFDYAKDYKVTCRFNYPLTREKIYKEIEKAKWPLSRVVGMVLRPGSLVKLHAKIERISFDLCSRVKQFRFHPKRDSLRRQSG